MADILWNTREAALATDGTPFGSEWECTGISIDSRSVKPGDLFIAIKGPSFDGHEYVRAALKAGAVAALVSRKPKICRDDDCLLKVRDTVKALEDLGVAARKRSTAKVVAVTGSVGKTGVKETLAHVLSKQGKTHATIGNLNNHFGLPLTLARMPKDCDYAVLELGMNHAGELTPLSKMAEPDVAVITTIASAHLEHFDGIEGIADAKCEIFSGLKAGGTAVINLDNAFYERMKTSAIKQNVSHLVTFGQGDGADFHAIDFEPLRMGGSDIKAELGNQRISYHVAHSGEHWVNNSLAVLACVDGLEADVKQAANEMSELNQLKGRGEVHVIELKNGSIQVIDESYNANEASMRAALDVLRQKEGRKIAVLGDMLELGPEEVEIHKGLKDAFENIDLVFTCGSLMRHLHEELPAAKRGGFAQTAESLAPLVLQSLQPNDVISIKSSRGSRTDLVLQELLDINQREVSKENN